MLGWVTINETFYADMQSGFFAVVVDTRRQDEWDAGHIANATFLPSMHETGDWAPISRCKACNIAIYCRTGRRSKLAADVLEANGFSNVYDALGITQWQANGHTLVTGAASPSVTPPCAGGGGACSNESDATVATRAVVIVISALVVALAASHWHDPARLGRLARRVSGGSSSTRSGPRSETSAPPKV